MSSARATVILLSALASANVACSAETPRTSTNAEEGQRIRDAIDNASDVPMLEDAIKDALTSSMLPADDALVTALAEAESSGARVSIANMYEALRASGFSIRFYDGRDLTTDEVVRVLQETLGAARLAGRENLAWEIALGDVVNPAELGPDTELGPTEAALVALSWASSANATTTTLRTPRVSAVFYFMPNEAALGVISVAVGGALWWGAAVLAGTAATVAIVSAPGLLAVGAGLALGIGIYMLGSAFLDGGDEIGSMAVGQTDSGNLVTGRAAQAVLEEIAQQNGWVCQDGVCQGNESPTSCPEDCLDASCGDGICSSTESCSSCEQDCGSCGCVVAVASVNSSNSENGPFLTPDRLTGYVSSDRDGRFKIYSASRSGPTDSFPLLLPVSDFNLSAIGDNSVFLSPDGLEAFWISIVGSGLGENEQIFRATRTSLAVPFTGQAAMTGLNSSANEERPRLSPDGLEIFFASDRTGGTGGMDLFRAVRTSTTLPFGVPARVAELNSAGHEFGGTFTPDGTMFYFASNRMGSMGGFDIMRATYSGGTFGTPEFVTAINSAADDFDPFIASDGTLYFARGSANQDIYMTTCL